MSREHIPLLALLILLAGCSSGSSEHTPSPTPVMITSTPAASSTYASRHQATIDVANGDGLVAAGGLLWVKTDDGRAVGIDPATNQVAKRIRLDTVSNKSKYCEGIGTSGTSLWACATTNKGTGVAQIDPNTGEVRRIVPANKVFDQLKLPATSRGIWVLAADGTSAGVIDPASGHLTAYPLGDRYLQLDARGDRVVATSTITNGMIVLDAGTGSVQGQRSMRTPRLAALTDTDIWVDTQDGLSRFNHDLALRAVYPDVLAGSDGDLIATGSSIWVRNGTGTITRIDAASGNIVDRITPKTPITGGSMLVAYDSIWLTSGDDGTVIRLRLAPDS